MYYFLHYGKFIRLLRFDWAGLIENKKINIILEPKVFLHCLLAVFSNNLSKLGYLCAKKMSCYVPVQGKTEYVIEIDSNILYLNKQIAGPSKNHLVDHRTVTWKAHLMFDNLEKDGKLFYVKASWVQIERKHKGHYIKKLFDVGVKNVVKFLAFSLETAGGENNTQLGSKKLESLKCIGNYYCRLLNQKSKSSKDNELSEYCQSTSATPGISQTPASAKRKDWELRLTVIAWVEQAFDQAYANYLSGFSSGFLSTKSLLTMLSLWHKSFIIFDGVTKANFFHKDISFQNMGVNENNELIICDFDMAIEPNSKVSELCERTKTIKFNARGVLSRKSHQVFHDRKFVYWLYSIALLQKYSISIMEKYVERIIDSSQKLIGVKVSKISFMA